jgi:hypothetical protein
MKKVLLAVLAATLLSIAVVNLTGCDNGAKWTEYATEFECIEYEDVSFLARDAKLD